MALKNIHIFAYVPTSNNRNKNNAAFSAEIEQKFKIIKILNNFLVLKYEVPKF